MAIHGGPEERLADCNRSPTGAELRCQGGDAHHRRHLACFCECPAGDAARPAVACVPRRHATFTDRYGTGLCGDLANRLGDRRCLDRYRGGAQALRANGDAGSRVDHGDPRYAHGCPVRGRDPKPTVHRRQRLHGRRRRHALDGVTAYPRRSLRWLAVELARLAHRGRALLRRVCAPVHQLLYQHERLLDRPLGLHGLLA